MDVPPGSSSGVGTSRPLLLDFRNAAPDFNRNAKFGCTLVVYVRSTCRAGPKSSVTSSLRRGSATRGSCISRKLYISSFSGPARNPMLSVKDRFGMGPWYFFGLRMGSAEACDGGKATVRTMSETSKAVVCRVFINTSFEHA